MSRHHGPMGNGYAKKLREMKREEAEDRNAATLTGRRKSARRHTEENR